MLAACLLASVGPVLAHDLWIEPSAFVTDAGKPIAVRLRVGVDLLGDPVARDASLIDRFIAVDAETSTPIPGSDGHDPAGVMRITTQGLLIIGYASKPSPLALTGQKFTEYLAEEGLETIIALRARRNETTTAVREQFSRCAKALLSSGPATRTQRDRALGFTLELIAEKNPYALSAGQALPARLLYRGRPISGVLVVAMNKRNPAAKQSARSDKNGRVTFRLSEPGMWLLKAVHMIEAPAGSAAQWESFWASMTFQLPDQGSTTGGRHK